MARDTTDDRLIETHDQLVEWIAKGCKPKSEWRIGTEHEKFGFCMKDCLDAAFTFIGNGRATLHAETELLVFGANPPFRLWFAS
ncbi:MAG: hypothetical protein AAFN43_08690, partial [Pseudomonadota bacterium]